MKGKTRTIWNDTLYLLGIGLIIFSVVSLKLPDKIIPAKDPFAVFMVNFITSIVYFILLIVKGKFSFLPSKMVKNIQY